MKQKKHIRSIDALRALAIFAVVAIHTSTKTFEVSGYDPNAFPLSIFINQIFRFAVPLFFAISGFTLELNYRFHKNHISFLKKRLAKIFLPYVFWSAVYYLWVFPHQSQNFLVTLLQGSASYQLYFIPALLIFYIIFPLLHYIYKYLSNRWVLLILAVAEIIFLYRDYFIGELGIESSFRFFILNYFIFIMGMVAAHNQDYLLGLVEKNRKAFFAGSLLTGLYVFLEGSGLYFKDRNYLDIYSQWRPSVLIYTIFIGLTLYYLFEKIIKENKYLHLLSNLSFFIYFIHIAVLLHFWNYVGTFFYKTPAFDIWFVTSVFMISLLTGILTRKIPILKIVTG